MSTQPIYAIKDKAPEFPCWLWGTVSRGWIRFQESEMHRNHEYGEPLWTHWHPDAPTAPTARPQAEVPEWAKEAMGELVELLTRGIREWIDHEDSNRSKAENQAILDQLNKGTIPVPI